MDYEGELPKMGYVIVNASTTLKLTMEPTNDY